MAMVKKKKRHVLVPLKHIAEPTCKSEVYRLGASLVVNLVRKLKSSGLDYAKQDMYLLRVMLVGCKMA